MGADVPAGLSDQVWDACRILFLTLVVSRFYLQAKDVGERQGKWRSLRDGLAISGTAGFVAMAAFSTPDSRLGTFLFWAILLVTPVVLGVCSARKPAADPWR